MTQPETESIEDLEASVDDARQAVATIEEKLLDGSPAVSAADLVDVEEELERRQGILARALDFKSRREARDAERARLEQIDGWKALVDRDFGAGDAEIVKAFDKAWRSLVPLVDAVTARNDARLQVIEALQELKLDPNDDITASTYGGQGSILRLDSIDTAVDDVNIVTLLAEAAYRATRAAGVTAAAGAFEPLAEVTQDRQYLEHVDAVDQGFAGPSDRLARSARLMASRVKG